MPLNTLAPAFITTISCHPTLLYRCALLPRWLLLLPNSLVECLPRLLHITQRVSEGTNLLLSCKKTHLSKIQNRFIFFLDLYPSCPHLFDIKRNMHTCITKDHWTAPQTLKGRTTKPQGNTNFCTSTAEWLRITALSAFPFLWNHSHQQ